MTADQAPIPDVPESKPDPGTGEAVVEAGVSRNIQLLAAVVFAALVAVVLVIVLTGGGDSTGNAGQDASKPVAGVQATATLLDGIPQDGLTLGNPSAPITIIEFVDLQCPFCAAYENTEQPKVIKRVVRTGQARLRIVPLAFLGPDSGALRNVLLRLSARNLAFNFLNLAFLNQGRENSGYASDAYLRKLVAEIPGTSPADASRVADAAINAARATADGLGRTLMRPGVDGTPFFRVGPSAADPSTYAVVNQSATPHPADSVIAAVQRAGRG